MYYNKIIYGDVEINKKYIPDRTLTIHWQRDQRSGK